MVKKLITILTLSLIIFSSQYAIAIEEQVLTGKDYFDVLHGVLSEAASTIDIQMYFMIANPEDIEDPVSILIEDLIKAKERGVMLRIILEDSKFSENYSAYKMLTLAGIKIDFDSPASLLHSKVIVIDGKIAILGSTNWSRAAFYNNHEASVIIQSEEICKQLLEDFSEIKLRQDVPALPYVIKGVNIHGDFLLSEKCGRNLVRDRARYAFDLYLLLLRKSQETKSNVISADFTSLKNELGCNNIRRPRLRLDKTYNLIRYDEVRKEITILDFKGQSVSSGAGDFTLPFEYWEYGFDKSLSLRAKYMYLVALSEAKKSARNPYWFRSQEDMARIYGVSDYTVSLGLQELERENIIRVERAVSEKDKYGERKANIYCLNPLISPEEFENKLNKLIQQYGREKVYHAQGLSDRLDKPKDLFDIETFIRLIEEFGYDKVKEANDIIVRMKKGSGLRDISYTVRLLKGEWE